MYYCLSHVTTVQCHHNSVAWKKKRRTWANIWGGFLFIPQSPADSCCTRYNIEIPISHQAPGSCSIGGWKGKKKYASGKLDFLEEATKWSENGAVKLLFLPAPFVFWERIGWQCCSLSICCKMKRNDKGSSIQTNPQQYKRERAS